MYRTTWVLSILVAVILIQNVESVKGRRGPPFLLGRSNEGLRRHHYRQHLSIMAITPPPEEWFTQTLDHFNSSDKRTFRQRYYVNDTFFKAGGPGILSIGGEGPENGKIAAAGSLPYMQWARDFNGAIFDLEHRFYGMTRPFEEQTTENLKYLSSRQALADMSDFIDSMSAKYSITKWIVYGGSYAGALAAWFREKYPTKAIGAVGSSAPMLATLDFHEYLEDIEEALDFWPACKASYIEGLKLANQKIWTEAGRTEMEQIFKPLVDFDTAHLRPKDIQTFLNGIIGPFMEATQYNGMLQHNVNDLCKVMTDASIGTPLQRIAAVYFLMYEVDYVDNDYNAMIEFLKDTTYDDDGSIAASRSWYWQTCSEFGYYQTTDYGKSMFGSLVPLNFYIDICRDVFGDAYDVMAVQENVRQSNLFYGGVDNYKATNVVLMYGSIDPWHKLGLYTTGTSGVVTHLINGTAHCADMNSPEDGEAPGLEEARKLIYDNVKKWLTSAASSSKVAEMEPDDVEDKPERPKPKQFESTIRTIELSEEERAKMRKRGKKGLSSNTPFMVMGRPYHGLVPEPAGEDADATDPPGFVRATITQPVDHFDTNNKDQYDERYWVNPQFYEEGGPQFLFLEGEGTAREKWLKTNVTFMRAVQKYKAMAFELEHRFYGNSRPYKNESSASMKYLTIKQALADIAQFIKTMNEKYKFSNPRWVTFGGSYPGSLSAWFRQDYPDLTVGAVASSAGPELKVDLFEYLVNAEKSIRNYDNSCGDNIKTGFQNMHLMSLTGDGRAQLSDIFKMKPAWTADTVVSSTDVHFFFQDAYDKFQGAVQYNKDNTGVYAKGGGIKEVCEIMNNATIGGEVQRIAKVYEYIVNFHGGNFQYLDNSYQNYVNYVKKDDYSDEGAVDARGWMYACCTELGFLQTTDIGENAFWSVCPVDFWLDFCEDVYGKDYVPARNIYKTVQDSNKRYKGRYEISATNIVFVHGMVDPWHLTGPPKERETDTMKIFFLQQTAHCADMYEPRPEDPQELTDVREKIFENIGNWIKQSPGTPSPSLTPATEGTITGAAKPSPSSTPAAEGTTTGAASVRWTFSVIAPLLYLVARLF